MKWAMYILFINQKIVTKFSLTDITEFCHPFNHHQPFPSALRFLPIPAPISQFHHRTSKTHQIREVNREERVIGSLHHLPDVGQAWVIRVCCHHHSQHHYRRCRHSYRPLQERKRSTYPLFSVPRQSGRCKGQDT